MNFFPIDIEGTNPLSFPNPVIRQAELKRLYVLDEYGKEIENDNMNLTIYYDMIIFIEDSLIYIFHILYILSFNILEDLILQLVS